jgi:hypothetical protein
MKMNLLHDNELGKKVYNPIILFACCSRDTHQVGGGGGRGGGKVPNPNSPHPLYLEEPHKT